LVQTESQGVDLKGRVLETFAREFKARHSFDGDDVTVLRENFPEVTFTDIPDAWVLGLDELLSRIPPAEVLNISQRNGFLFVSIRDGEWANSDILWDEIEKAESKIYDLDSDLHKLLE
jgi:hypothetical protein